MPDISNATVATGTGLSTAGNGGRKIVRLSNGWLVAGLHKKDSGFVHGRVELFISKDDGSTWSRLCWVYDVYKKSYDGFSLSSEGTKVYVLMPTYHSNYGSGLQWGISFATIEATTQTDVQVSPSFVDTNQSANGTTSLAINDTGTELHATWSSKNSTYSSSFNIRYAKGTINGDGSVTWDAVQQVTVYNSSTRHVKTPSISVRKDGYPVIAMCYYDGASNIGITNVIRDGTGWYFWNGTRYSTGGGYLIKTIASGINGYEQSSPSFLFVPATINGLANGRLWVAWHGKDETDSAKFNVQISYSDDGGLTWATPIKLTSGNTFDCMYPIITADMTGEVFVLYEQHEWAPDVDIFMRTYMDGVWQDARYVAYNEPNSDSSPSTMVDFTAKMYTPPFIYTDSVEGIRFSGEYYYGVTLNTGTEKDLGLKEGRTVLSYSITPEEGVPVTQITERVNGEPTMIEISPTSLNRTFTIPEYAWDALKYWHETEIEILVRDENNVLKTIKHTFTKKLSNPAPISEINKANEDSLLRIKNKREAISAVLDIPAYSTFDDIIVGAGKYQKGKIYSDEMITIEGSQGNGRLIAESSSGQTEATAISANSKYIFYCVSGVVREYNNQTFTFRTAVNTGYTSIDIASSENIVITAINQSSSPGGIYAFIPGGGTVFSRTENSNPTFHNSARAVAVDLDNDEVLSTSGWTGSIALNVHRHTKSGVLVWSGKEGTSYFGDSIAPYGNRGAVMCSTLPEVIVYSDVGLKVISKPISGLKTSAIASKSGFVYVARYDSSTSTMKVCKLDANLNIIAEAVVSGNASPNPVSFHIVGTYLFVSCAGSVLKYNTETLSLILSVSLRDITSPNRVGITQSQEVVSFTRNSSIGRYDFKQYFKIIN